MKVMAVDFLETGDILNKISFLKEERYKLSKEINGIDDQLIGLREELLKRKELQRLNLLNHLPVGSDTD